MTTPLQHTDLDYSVCATARKVMAKTRCSFAAATTCVSACGGDFERACDAVNELRAARWTAKGNGDYRVFADGFFADVHLMYDSLHGWSCRIDHCSDATLDSETLKTWCIAAINGTEAE